MSVDVSLDAARVCEYCGAGGTLVTDLDGDLVCPEGFGCAAPPSTTRVAGCVVPLEALDTPEPVLVCAADAMLLGAGDELDAESMTERERLAASAALRLEVRRAHHRVAYLTGKLPRLAGARALRELAEASVVARAADEALIAWETRCNALRMGRARAGQRRARA
jgi:hypothetical protein